MIWTQSRVAPDWDLCSTPYWLSYSAENKSKFKHSHNIIVILSSPSTNEHSISARQGKKEVSWTSGTSFTNEALPGRSKRTEIFSSLPDTDLDFEEIIHKMNWIKNPAFPVAPQIVRVSFRFRPPPCCQPARSNFLVVVTRAVNDAIMIFYPPAFDVKLVYTHRGKWCIILDGNLG